jgi:hypothetical protein
MSDFKPDEIVDITIKGARVEGEDARWLNCLLGAHRVNVPLDGTGVTVEHAMPEITPGDVLTDGGGGVWFAQRYFADFDKPDDWAGCNEAGWRTVLVPMNGGPLGDGSGMRPEDVNERYAPFTVVHHEDEREMPS